MNNGRLVQARLVIATILTVVLVILLIADLTGLTYVVRPAIVLAITLAITALLVGSRT